MSQQEHQVMLQGEHRRRWILVGILLIAVCAAIIEIWRPGTVHDIASRIYKDVVHVFDYLGSLASSFRDFLKTITK
jgi:hypothetical protein